METTTETRKTEGKKELSPAGKEQESQRSGVWRTLGALDEMERMMERMAEGFPLRSWLHPFHRERPEWPEFASLEIRTPRMDVINRDEEVLVRAEIPGVEKKDLDISVTDSSITIKGTVQREEKEEKGDYARCEIACGAFVRTLPLPAAVDGSKAKATFKDGMLELSLPKKESTKRHSVKLD
jgi:HSP20 family protein